MSWKYIETPVRKKRFFTRPSLVAFSVFASAVFLAAGAYGYYSGGVAQRLGAEEQKISSYMNYDYSVIYRFRTCFLDFDQDYTKFSPECAAQQSGGKAVILWGDSHAAALSGGLRTLVPGLVQYTSGGCPPVSGILVVKRPYCPGINDFVLKEIGRLKPGYVLLHANWMEALKEEAALGKLDETIALIRSKSVLTNIVILGGVPQWQPSLPVYLLKNKISLEAARHVRPDRYGELLKAENLLREFSRKRNVMFISLLDILCEKDSCAGAVGDDGSARLAFWDYGHLTLEGAVFASKSLREGIFN